MTALVISLLMRSLLILVLFFAAPYCLAGPRFPSLLKIVAPSHTVIPKSSPLFRSQNPQHSAQSFTKSTQNLPLPWHHQWANSWLPFEDKWIPFIYSKHHVVYPQSPTIIHAYNQDFVCGFKVKPRDVTFTVTHNNQNIVEKNIALNSSIFRAPPSLYTMQSDDDFFGWAVLSDHNLYLFLLHPHKGQFTITEYTIPIVYNVKGPCMIVSLHHKIQNSLEFWTGEQLFPGVPNCITPIRYTIALPGQNQSTARIDKGLPPNISKWPDFTRMWSKESIMCAALFYNIPPPQADLSQTHLDLPHYACTNSASATPPIEKLKVLVVDS